jgi:hypothetical protein
LTCVVGVRPKSTFAETPTVQGVLVDVKYASLQDPGNRDTLRAIGGFGGAPDPAADHPRTKTIPFDES